MNGRCKPCDIHAYLKAYLEEEREVEQSGIVGKVVDEGNDKDYDWVEGQSVVKHVVLGEDVLAERSVNTVFGNRQSRPVYVS